MIVAIGVDAVEIERIRGLYARSGDRFVQRVFTDDEAAYCKTRSHPAESLAARFAAKEAVMKCLGTGWAEGLAFRQIEVQRLPSGDTRLVVTGTALTRANELGIQRWHVSLTHTKVTATAFVIAES
ncbi:MAG TPA: holo-ACP synthase [Planctomycetes bacterium]|nr:holo-ACP synthase [Planctomycetota bacterium]